MKQLVYSLILVTSLLAFTSCTVNQVPNLAPIETLFEGEGWTCYAAPDAFKKAGVVVELTADGKYLFDSDHSSRNLEAKSVIGTTKYSLNSSLGAVLKLLESVGVAMGESTADATLSRTTTLQVSYGGTKKQVLPGSAARAIADTYSDLPLNPTSRYFVFRESHSARSLEILFDREAVASLTADVNLDAIVEAHPKISRSSRGNYHLKEDLDEPVGICAIATELLVERGFDGRTTVKTGTQFPLPDDLLIEEKEDGNSKGLPRKGSGESSTLIQYLARSNVPRTSFLKLRAWGALPQWVLNSAELRLNWLDSLHSNVTRTGWPKDLREATARTVPGRGLSLGRSSAVAREISVFDVTPVFLQELVEIVNYPLVPPDSDNPNAKMILDPARREGAVTRLSLMLGMLEHTGYLEGSTPTWGGAVTFGTRFIYYHELGHLSDSLLTDSRSTMSLEPHEIYLKDEILADQFAFSMLALELRNQSPEVQFVGFAGMASAMSLLAGLEFVEEEHAGGLRKTKRSSLRMARLAHWTRISTDQGDLAPEALTGLQTYSDFFRSLLRDVDAVPSPVFSLLVQTADRPSEDWTKARNEIVKWCVFGDAKKVLADLKRVRDSAFDQALVEPRARRVLEVIAYLTEELAPLEPELGLVEALSQ